jgi:hypothetical protein
MKKPPLQGGAIGAFSEESIGVIAKALGRAPSDAGLREELSVRSASLLAADSRVNMNRFRDALDMVVGPVLQISRAWR